MVKHCFGNGTECSATDPDREMWYSAGVCGYWTDDWSELSTTRGIPCCPRCGQVGFQSTVRKWLEGAKRFEGEGNPRYVEFVESCKETCDPTKPWMVKYNLWLKESEGKEEMKDDNTI